MSYAQTTHRLGCRQEKGQVTEGAVWSLPFPAVRRAEGRRQWGQMPFRVRTTRCGACGTRYMTPAQQAGAVEAARRALQVTRRWPGGEAPEAE